MDYKKPSFWVIMAGVLACLVLGVFFLTHLNGNSGNVKPHNSEETESNLSQALDTRVGINESSEPDEPAETSVADWESAEIKDDVKLFQSVLLGEREFYLAEDNDYLLSMNIANICSLFDVSDAILEFAVVDLDRDGEEEVVLFVIPAAGDAGGRVILRRWDDMVYAYVVNFRNMWELKTDGTYEYSMTANNDGFARITGFTKTGFTEDRYTYETGSYEGADTFVVNHESVSENKYKKSVALEHGKKKAVWHEFNEENIMTMADLFQKRVTWIDPAVRKAQVLKEISEREFLFHEGASNGGYVIIREDGSFSGRYTRKEDAYYYLESSFTGNLELTECVDAYTWRMKVTRLRCEREIGTKWKEEGFTYEEILPPGMMEGEEYLLCLPGKPMEELPRGILYWRGVEIEKAGEWNAYGIGAIPKISEEAITDLSQVEIYDLMEYGEDLALYSRDVYPNLMQDWSAKALSPDRSKYLYGKSENQDGKTVLTIGVIDAYEYHRPTEFRLNTETGSEIARVYWLSDTQVGAETRVNSSTSEFFVFDLETGQEVEHYIEDQKGKQGIM